MGSGLVASTPKAALALGDVGLGRFEPKPPVARGSVLKKNALGALLRAVKPGPAPGLSSQQRSPRRFPDNDPPRNPLESGGEPW